MGARVIALELRVVDPDVSLASGVFTAWFLAFYGITGVQNILTTCSLFLFIAVPQMRTHLRDIGRYFDLAYLAR
jgi:hypothetical protein